MAKIKLAKFELVSSIRDSKKLVDYLQKFGCTHIDNADVDALQKYDNTQIILSIQNKKDEAVRALDILNKAFDIKTGMIASLKDYSVVEYDEYIQVAQSVDEVSAAANAICKIQDNRVERETEIVRLRNQIQFLQPWLNLDLPMRSTMTAKTKIFIGFVKDDLTSSELKLKIAQEDAELDGIEIQRISHYELQSCFVVVCHKSNAQELENALSKIGFVVPDNPPPDIPMNEKKAIEKEIEQKEAEIESCGEELEKYSDWIERIKCLIDYYSIQIEKYKAIELAGTTDKIIYFTGFVPQRKSEELKFEVERRFVASLELSMPDYENENVPVLIENGAFASGVENITEMYAIPSNEDVDPNPVMSIFYYSLFGLMLSDAGYGLLMVIFGALMKWKFKVTGAKLKTANFAFFCGISTVIWGALFGSWFGDLIPTICTTFLHMENPPNLTIWFDPKEESMKLLIYSFGFGILHLFVGLGVRFFNLMRRKDYISAFCDTIPVYVFVSGFAIVAKDFLEPVSEQVKSVGTKLLIIGAILIVLTAGHSAKNILGKLGGGLYGLYNTTTGYMSDILSYSRLLALNLVTGVIAMVVNLLGAMMGNIFAFIIIFLIGHGINLAINLIGTYVHTNRLQYVEFFSKFYEGGGRSFTPFKLNTQYLRFKEDNKNE